jgi:hypothetical protein
MDDTDLELRRRTYAFLIAHGRAPAAAELGDTDEVVAGWRRLHEEHAVVLDPDRNELRMLNPFSAVPTVYRVHCDGRSWYGNCAWDALGVCAALGRDGRIETTCPDCAAPLMIEVRNEQPDDDSLLFHCFVPAARWWDDIVFT